MWKRIARIGLWTLPLLCLAAVGAGRHRLQETNDLKQAWTSMLEGRYSGAARLYARHRGRFCRNQDASLGLATARLMSGEGEDDGPGSPPDQRTQEASTRLRLLFFSALGRLEYEAALRLARFLEGSDPQAGLLETAALTEAARIPQARRRFEQVPIERRTGWLSDRLLTVLSATSPDTIVRDRRGRTLGRWNTSGLWLEPDVDSRLIPPALSSVLKSQPASSGLRVSIDLELSRLALEALASRRGSIVLVDSLGGEILAAVSDAKTRMQEGTPSFEQRLEPASIVKVVTLSAGVREGLDIEGEFRHMTCRGAERYRGGILYCSYRAGPLGNVQRAMALSCNVAFANLGIQVGRQSLLEELRRYGFDRPQTAPFQFGRILQPSGNQRQLASLSIGLDVLDITPLHAAYLAAAVANQGLMPRPTLLAAQDGYLGLTPRPLEKEAGQRVFEPRQLPALISAMRAVVGRGGTAAGVSNPLFPVAMKTGTGRNPGKRFHTNYIGIGPLPDPSIAFCVRITGERTSTRVGRASREVSRRLLAGLGKHFSGGVTASRPGWPTEVDYRGEDGKAPATGAVTVENR